MIAVRYNYMLYLKNIIILYTHTHTHACTIKWD